MRAPPLGRARPAPHVLYACRRTGCVGWLSHWHRCGGRLFAVLKEQGTGRVRYCLAEHVAPQQ